MIETARSIPVFSHMTAWLAGGFLLPHSTPGLSNHPNRLPDKETKTAIGCVQKFAPTLSTVVHKLAVRIPNLRWAYEPSKYEIATNSMERR
jgi:hypothetical protein